jgi:predicted PurR-regulated permease PerM
MKAKGPRPGAPANEGRPAAPPRKRRRRRGRTSPVVVALLVLALLFALHSARAFLLPLVLALMLALALRPVVRGLGRLHVPQVAGATLVMAALAVAVGFGAVRLQDAVLESVDRLPTTLRRVEYKLRGLSGPVESVSRAAEEVERIAQPEGGGERRAQVELRPPGIRDALLTELRELLFGAVVAFFVLFLLLATGERLLVRLAELLARSSNGDKQVELVLETERNVARYLGTVSLINLTLGCAVGTAVWALGMPNPVLWGVIAAGANFVPYLGAFVAVSVLTVASLITFEDLGRAVLPPLAYSALSVTEGMLVTPVVLGRRFALHPVVVFVWLFFWGWLWGVVGALLAVPMLASLKIVADNVPRLAPLSRLLSH